MITLFDIKDVNRAPSSFNTDKLKWLNQQYIKAADPTELAGLLGPHLARRHVREDAPSRLARIVEVQRERARTLEELAAISLFYFQDMDLDAVPEKQAKKAFAATVEAPLTTIRAKLEALVAWQRQSIHAAMDATVAELGIGFGKLGMPLRIAVTAGHPAPELDLTMELVGKEACLRRIDAALERIRLG